MSHSSVDLLHEAQTDRFEPRNSTDVAALLSCRVNPLQTHPNNFTNVLYSYIQNVREMAEAQTAWLLIKPVLPGFSPDFIFVSSSNPKPIRETQEHALAIIAEATDHGENGKRSDARPMVHHFTGLSDGSHLFHIQIPRMESEQFEHLSFENRRLISQEMRGGMAGDVWINLSYRDGRDSGFSNETGGRFWGQPWRGASPAPNRLNWVFALGAQMAWQIYELSTLLIDPTTGLPRRSELQTHINRILASGSDRHYIFGLALINPDEFEQVNQHLGRERGDAVLREIGQLLQAHIRQSDRIYHYGSAIFAVTFQVPDARDANPAIAHLWDMLSHHGFLNGKIKLNFSIGGCTHEIRERPDPEIDHIELLRRADCALNAAKVSGGAQTMLWTPAGVTTSLNNHDRLSGIFTADTKKDYRNMLLLWDTVQVIASQTDMIAVANEFVERVRTTFKPRCATLISIDNNGQPRFLSRSPSANEAIQSQKIDDIAQFFTAERRHLIARAQKSEETEQTEIMVSADGPKGAWQAALAAYAVPLIGSNHHHSCLYVDGPRDEFRLDASDLVFLKVLAKQVAVALERCELTLRWQREQEGESRRLREEVRGLRQALDHSKLVYQSARMESVLKLVRTVAPTDATVLITGESGTGKEMIARSLHQQSRRHAGPFITVDFGAISPGLMETELFGHAKGAFTGASGASLGRIAQARNGTVFLDEIGEIPLDVQAKLLRFLQEKEITPVGATHSRKVDVRIVAATNRDLPQEVARGRFRQDLYYRLKVVEITAPPLRQRPDDILPLAHYFLEKLAIQYDKRVRRLSPEVVAMLLDHPWPGNVRELQNRLLQAVITCGDEEITPADFSLGSVDSALAHNGKPADRPSTAFDEPPDSARAGRAADSSAADLETWPQTGGDPGEDGDPWAALRGIFARQVAAATTRRNAAPLPLGIWLDEDLVLAADAAHGGVGRQAAAVLGMAETTFRRHLEKAKHATARRTSPRHAVWSPAVPVLERLAGAPALCRDGNILKAARRLLLAEISARLPDDDRLGSALLGVSAPTYRRWKAQIDGGAPASLQRDLERPPPSDNQAWCPG